MVEIQDTLVSLDLFREKFCCDINACGGACCIEGDAGAPVKEEEIAELETAAEIIQDELTASAQKVINEQGVVYVDRDGDFVTSIVDGKDCVFTCRNEHGHCLCAIERAYREGRTAFKKPVSCSLYPVRLSTVGGMTAINYHRWEVCRPAVELGRKLDIPVYQFLKEPLTRVFGQAWWDECQTVAEELKKQGYI
ncbi:MAG: DUF3109 family protein [Bacteroides sp.]|nr:DUF3109 family protein [Roseburia sp.]MCM1346661.1 DUF3109 family protein [Bacteroides sp.]MCM1421618.1 DUF3109 family protein [Bacteroides sp.]